MLLFDRTSRPLIVRVVKNYVRPYLKLLLQAIFWMVLSAGMTAAFAKLVQPVMDHVLIQRREHLVVPMALAVCGCFILRGISTYLHTVLMNRLGQNIVSDIQNQMYRHILKLDLGFHHTEHSGALISRVVSDVNVMRVAVAEGLTSLGKNSITLMLLIGVMFWQDWRLAAAIFVIFPLIAVLVARLGKKLRKISGRTQEALGEMTALLTQSFQGIRQVKAYGREEFESERMAAKIKAVRDLNVRNVRTSNMNTPINETLVGLTIFGLIVYGGISTASGHMTPGALMSFITAFLMSYEPMKRMAKLHNTLQVGLGGAQRVFDLLDRQSRIRSPAAPEPMAQGTPGIVFENVSFAYEKDGAPVLERFSLNAKAGSMTALVGPSGGGKSTVLNMILRFYDADQGCVMVGGQDVRTLKLGELRSHIALVSQEVAVFDDTVLGNIAYGRDGADENAVIAAAKAAHAHEFIVKMPQGYETRLGENGVKLSGGQRQRIALARAFLKDAPILLLDEATSALDTESERMVQESLGNLMRGRTTLVIAHRLSTVRDADSIVVISGGKVAEEGTHDSLMAAGGVYAGLYARNKLSG